MLDGDVPEILTASEAWDLLRGEDFGRVALCSDGVPSIFPVNYTVVDEGIVFRTSTGTKLTAATEHAVLAFEVDHRDPSTHTGWSVVVVGASEVVHDVDTLLRAARAVLEPDAGGSRGHLVLIRPDHVTGRRISRARL